MRTARAPIGVGAVAVLVASLALAGCGSGDERPGSAESTTTTTTTVSDRSTTTASGVDSPGSGSSGSDASGGGSPSGGSSSGLSGGGAPPDLAIEEFGAPATVDCSGGDPQVSLTWSVRTADRVTISVDGPGVYAEYGPSGETAILFPCPGPHTYLLTAYGPGGATQTEIVTVTSENVPTAGEGGGPSTTDTDGSGGD